jgi:hypothetical protein
MSEQNQRNNRPHKISAKVLEEMLRVPISIIAPALVWIRVWRSARVQIFSGTQRTPSVSKINRNNGRDTPARQVGSGNPQVNPDPGSKDFTEPRSADDSESMTISAFLGTNQRAG